MKERDKKIKQQVEDFGWGRSEEKKNVNVIGNQVKNMRQYGKKTRKHFTVWISGEKKIQFNSNEAQSLSQHWEGQGISGASYLENFGCKGIFFQINIQRININLHQVLQQFKVNVFIFFQRWQGWSTFECLQLF